MHLRGSIFWKASVFFILCAFPLIVLNAQSRFRFIDVSAGAGNVIRNYPGIPKTENPALYSRISLSNDLDGSRVWHAAYPHCKLGMDLTIGSLGERFVYGWFAGIQPTFVFELAQGQHWFMDAGAGLGSAYFSKKFDEGDNPANVLIGSRFTFFANASLRAGFQMSNDCWLTGKLTLLHASNSHYKLPNVGLNMPAAEIGIQKRLNGSIHSSYSDTIFSKLGKIRPMMRLAIGINEFGSSDGPVNGPGYRIYLASAGLVKKYGLASSYSVALEAWYNQGVYDYIVSQEFYDSDWIKKSFCVSAVIGHEFLMGHFGVMVNGGIYLYNPFYLDRLKTFEKVDFKTRLKGYVPARLGFQYHFIDPYIKDAKSLYWGLYIKSNFSQADFLESGFGFVF